MYLQKKVMSSRDGQQLGVLAALAEDMSLVPNTHTGQFIINCNSGFKVSDSFS